MQMRLIAEEASDSLLSIYGYNRRELDPAGDKAK